jgi:hypothetical protein
MPDEDRADGADADEPAGGGTWLTYRYRLGGPGTPDAAGTMKAPSFLSAARRILARRLGAMIGPVPAYLRLRAAGEQEVLFRVSRTGADGDGPPHVERVPATTYTFPDGVEPPPGPAADSR